jgi:hypothetical protein
LAVITGVLFAQRCAWLSAGLIPQTRIRKPTSPDQYCEFDGHKLLAVNKFAVNKFG